MKQMTFADAEYARQGQADPQGTVLDRDGSGGAVERADCPDRTALSERRRWIATAYPLMAMLRIHLMQNWFGYSDPAMEEALYETTILRQLAGLSMERIPDETTILNFRRLLEKHELAAGILCVINGYLGDRGLSLRQGTIVDATLIRAPVQPRTRTASATRKCTRPRRGTSITLA